MADVNLGSLIATTLKDHKKSFADNVTANNAMLATLKEKKNIRTVSGGRQIEAPIIYDGNNTFQRYSGFQVLDINGGDGIDAVTYDPVQSAVHFSINGREERMNRGKEKIISLVEGKMKAAMADMRNNINYDLLSNGSLSNQIGGLQLLIADDPTTNTSVGGINQSTNSWWRNKVYDFSDNSKTAASNMQEGMNKLYLDCTRGTEKPDLIIMDENYYSIYEASLQTNQRFTSEKMGVLGFESLKYKAADVVFESTASGMPSNHAYFINTDYIQFNTYEGANMEPQTQKSPVNQDGYVVPILFMGNLITTGRQFQGVLKD